MKYHWKYVAEEHFHTRQNQIKLKIFRSPLGPVTPGGPWGPATPCIPGVPGKPSFPSRPGGPMGPGSPWGPKFSFGNSLNVFLHRKKYLKQFRKNFFFVILGWLEY